MTETALNYSKIQIYQNITLLYKNSLYYSTPLVRIIGLVVGV
jgi:hypothetical protein